MVKVKVKVKVKLSLCLSTTPRRRIGGIGVYIHAFFDLGTALDGGEWSASRPGRFIPRKELLVPIG
jgi:hypothetical protein